MPFQIVRNDITRVAADAIVNSANPMPVVGGGTDAAVYAAAGADRLLELRRKIGEIAPGSAAVTPALRLPARHIIHTVGPVWVDGAHGEREILRSCYAVSLAAAARLKCRSVAFPLIATGVYGFPKEDALQIALAEISRFLLTHDMTVILVVFDRNAFALSGKLVGEIEAFIDDHEVAAVREAEFAFDPGVRNWSGRLTDRLRVRQGLRRKNDAEADPGPAVPLMSKPLSGEIPVCASAPAAAPRGSAEDDSLEDLLKQAGETFQQRLLHLIDASGMTDAAVYKKANIDRRVFSKIRSRKDYRPKKETAVAFSIALELDWATMSDLLSRAGIAFSPSNRFDLIIRYFVTHHNYDIFEINAALFKYGQPILGEA